MTAKILLVNQWLVQLDSGEFRLKSASGEFQVQATRLDPKSLQLLVALAQQPGVVLDKETLFGLLWPGQVVTDDALSRALSRLRKALQDDPKSPQIIETIPRRGYRCIAEHIDWLPENALNSSLAPKAETEQQTASNQQYIKPDSRQTKKQVVPFKFGLLLLSFSVLSLLVAGSLYGWFYAPTATKQTAVNAQTDIQPLVRQADDYYAQIRRQDNEMAIELYQQIMTLKPEAGAGQAGLANALVQQVLRWPNPAHEQPLETQNLQQALQAGRTQSPEAQKKLQRALALAQSAVESAPESARAYKALGFVYSALGQFDAALSSYKKAISLNPNAWDALLNYGDVSEITGNLTVAIDYYEQAFNVMRSVRAEQSARVNPWLADFGASIAEKYLLLNRVHDAEIWYRKVLNFAPFNARATKGLVALLENAGDSAAADRLCTEYHQRIGERLCNPD